MEGRIDYADDADWLSFNITNAGNYKISQASTTGGDVWVELYSNPGSGNYLQRSNVYGTGSSKAKDYTMALSSGTYYIKVYPYYAGHQDLTYTVQICDLSTTRRC